jgi:hypothetical protein
MISTCYKTVNQKIEFLQARQTGYQEKRGWLDTYKVAIVYLSNIDGCQNVASRR